jgi:hypothetical protein
MLLDDASSSSSSNPMAVDCSRWLPYSIWTTILNLISRRDLLNVIAVNKCFNMLGSHVLVLQELENKYVMLVHLTTYEMHLTHVCMVVVVSLSPLHA